MADWSSLRKPPDDSDYDVDLRYSNIATILEGSSTSLADATAIEGLPSTDVSDYHFNFLPDTLPSATGNSSFVNIIGPASDPIVHIQSSESGDEG